MKADMVKAHPVILTDIGNGRILVLDLDKEDPLAKENILWEWIPRPEQGWQYTTQKILKDALSGVKYRWSEYHKTHVVLFTGSRGSVGMIEYPSGKCLWEAMVGVSPHSIELLPNGDIVVATSGGGDGDKGRLHYLTRSEDGTYIPTTELMLYGAHGLVWDPVEQTLWANGSLELAAYELTSDGNGRRGLALLPGKGTKLPNEYGHDLTQAYDDPDILWLTTSPCVYQFSKSRNTLLTEFKDSETIHPLLRAKGLGSFPDGVVVWVAYGRHTSIEHPPAFSALWPREDGSYNMVTYTDVSSGWNKVRVFSDRHQ